MPALSALSSLFSGDLLKLFKDASALGPVVRLDQAFFRLYQINDVEMIKEVLLDRGKHYRKGSLMRRLAAVTGEGLLINDGELWRRHRRLANPAFSPRKLDGYAEFMNISAEKLIERWLARAPNAPIDLLKEMSAVTLMSLLRAIFGVDFEEGDAEVSVVINDLLNEVVRRGSSFFAFPLYVPTPGNVRFRNKIEEANRILASIVQKRRALPLDQEDAPNDLLGQWLQLESTDNGFTPEEMRDELMTMLIAGHHSLAIALAWSLYFVARDPLVQARLQQEVDAFEQLPQKNTELHQIPYTLGIFLEALRFYPQPPILLREALHDHTVSGVKFREGDQLMLNVLSVHHHPDCWTHSHDFQPQRYGPQFLEDSLMQQHYLSFGGGARSCIGRRFALLEGALTLARLARRFQFELTSDEVIPPRFAAMLVPMKPILMRLKTR